MHGLTMSPGRQNPTCAQESHTSKIEFMEGSTRYERWTLSHNLGRVLKLAEDTLPLIGKKILTWLREKKMQSVFQGTKITHITSKHCSP